MSRQLDRDFYKGSTGHFAKIGVPGRFGVLLSFDLALEMSPALQAEQCEFVHIRVLAAGFGLLSEFSSFQQHFLVRRWEHSLDGIALQTEEILKFWDFCRISGSASQEWFSGIGRISQG